MGDRSKETGTNPDFAGGNGNKTISQITSRALRKKNASEYDMMSKSEEDDIELTGHDGHITPVEPGPDHDSEKAIWTTKTFQVN